MLEDHTRNRGDRKVIMFKGSISGGSESKSRTWLVKYFLKATIPDEMMEMWLAERRKGSG